jgi:hypothetical protein
MLGIAVILAVYASVVTLVILIFYVGGFSSVPLVNELIGIFVLILFFTFPTILASIGILVFPAVIIAQRSDNIINFRQGLYLGVVIGCLVATPIIGTMSGYLPAGLLLGASSGALGGFLWWRWIGSAEAKFKLQNRETIS